MKKLCKILFGSHLYGTNTESSDLDYKGVYLPDFKELALGEIQKVINFSTNTSSQKNSSDDVDEEYFSLQYFIKLACQGQTNTIDMIHAPVQNVIESSYIWNEIHNNRAKFYHKDMKAFLGYCKTQAAKYSVKGSRLATVSEYISFFKEKEKTSKLKEYWGEIKELEHARKIVQENNRNEEKRALEICGRVFQADSRSGWVTDVLKKFYASYGERAKLAELNQGIDWKAVSHAFRAGFQLKEIFETGDLKFPLEDKDFILKIKQGQLHYKNDGIGEKLNNLICEVEELSSKSSFPEKADEAFWRKFVIETVRDNLK